MRKGLLGFALCLLSGLWIGCDPPPECQTKDVSFTQCIAPTLVANCTGGNCHGASNPGKGLRLDENIYQNIVNKNVSAGGQTLNLIKPGDHEESYLYLKMLQDKPVEGGRMPIGFRPLLSPSQMEMFRNWINAGAKNDDPNYKPGDEKAEKPEIPAGIKDVSFKTDLQPIFAKSCLGSGCHGTVGPSGNLVLESDGHKNIVGKASLNPKYKLVDAGKPLMSLLLLKLLEKRPTSVGSRMPIGPALSKEEIAKVYIWIEEGAKDN